MAEFVIESQNGEPIYEGNKVTAFNEKTGLIFYEVMVLGTSADFDPEDNSGYIEVDSNYHDMALHLGISTWQFSLSKLKG